MCNKCLRFFLGYKKVIKKYQYCPFCGDSNNFTHIQNWAVYRWRAVICECGESFRVSHKHMFIVNRCPFCGKTTPYLKKEKCYLL